ncbi:MAG: LysR family transcriptional regulator [Chloroflexi bacterium]|nr:LysR family transcriptional regulator [Chloroflexota bacterium]
MTLNQLRIFYVSARLMSFTAAAEELCLTQPAITLQIQSLERDLGLKLFERVGNKLRLTDAGQALYKSAGTIILAEDEARKIVAELRSASRRRVVVAANTTGGMYALPPILLAFGQAHPDVAIGLDIESSEQIIERLLQNGVDVGLVGGPMEDKRIVAEPILKDELAVIVSPAHEAAQHSRMTLGDLAMYPLVMAEPRSRTRMLIERTFRAAGLRVQPSLQLTGTEAVKKAVESGLGVGIVSKFSVERELYLGVLKAIEIEGVQLVRPLELIHRKGRRLSHAARLFRSFALEYARREFGPLSDLYASVTKVYTEATGEGLVPAGAGAGVVTDLGAWRPEPTPLARSRRPSR